MLRCREKFWVLLAVVAVQICLAVAGTSRGGWSPDTVPRGWSVSSKLSRNKIVALLDSECTAIDFSQEDKCSDVAKIARNRRCLKLPYAVQPGLRDRKRAMHRTTYMAVFRRISKSLQKMGFSFEMKVDKDFLESHRSMAAAEFLIIPDYLVEEIIFHPELTHTRLIIIQTTDLATLPKLPCSYSDPRILAIFQHTSLYSLKENNGPLIGDERLFAWIDPMNTTIQMRSPVLGSSELNKVATVMPYVYRYRHPLDCGGRKWFLKIRNAFEMERKEWLRPLSERKYDVVVVAPQNRMYPPIINEHRLMAIEMVKYLEQRYQLKVRIYLRPPTTREFYESVQNARVYVSPFGFGEAVGKDYESILSGTILVKPNSMRLTSSPDIYASGYSVSCRTDFADLGHVVLTILNNLDKAQTLADKAYLNLVKSSTDEQITLRIGKALKAAVESPTARAVRSEEYCKNDDGKSAKPPVMSAAPSLQRLMSIREI